MVVVVEDAALAAHQGIERLGDAHAEALHGAAETLVAVRFQHDVDVIALDAELDQTASEPRPGMIETRLDTPERTLTAQVPHMIAHAQRDVDRQRLIEPWPRRVRDAIAPLPSRSFAAAAMAAKWKVTLRGSPSHDFGNDLASRRGRV